MTEPTKKGLGTCRRRSASAAPTRLRGVEIIGDRTAAPLLEGVRNMAAFIDVGVHQHVLIHMAGEVEELVRIARPGAKRGDVVV
jgi:transcriptional accessory protein Tex/SPT6